MLHIKNAVANITLNWDAGKNYLSLCIINRLKHSNYKSQAEEKDVKSRSNT